MNRYIAALTAIGLMTAPAAAQTSLLTKAKTLLADRAVDPSSLQFRKTRIVNERIQGKPLTIVCGEYNAKNKMGGYTGFQTFAYEPTILKGVMTFDGSSFDFITPDGQDFGTAGAFDEANARIIAACLGLAQ